MRLLLVEDEKDLSEALKKILEISEYIVDTVYDGETALAYISENHYDGVILDVMLPGIDGFSVVRQLRCDGNDVPVLMLTAKSEVDDKVEGLDAGADDYLTKPFVVKELLARVRAITRRQNEVRKVCRFANITLDPERFELRAEGVVRLTNKEYQLMEYLVKNHNLLLSTEKIFSSVWASDSDVEINVVWVFISMLRKKLKSVGATCVISAARGVGYRLEEQVD